MPHDLYIEFDYAIKGASATIINTNIKDSYIDDFLSEVVRSQMGLGADKQKAAERDVYNVLIRCGLSYDHISVSSNAGNKSLTTGIMAHSIGNWHFSDSLLEAYAKSDDFVGPPKPKG